MPNVLFVPNGTVPVPNVLPVPKGTVPNVLPVPNGTVPNVLPVPKGVVGARKTALFVPNGTVLVPNDVVGARRQGLTTESRKVPVRSPSVVVTWRYDFKQA